MKIAVWSPTPFAGRKSAHLLLFALQAISEDGGEQVILHADAAGSGPEHFLLSGGQRKRMMEQRDFGVEFLAGALLCERFTKELVKNAAYSFAEGKLHVLPSGNAFFYRQEEKATGELCGMMRQADKEFGNVWIELPAGESELTAGVMQEADCVIVSLTQSPWETEKLHTLPKSTHMFYVVGAYEKRNPYTVRNLELLLPELRGRCAAVPYYGAFSEACCAGKVESFCMRKTGGDEFRAFFHAVKRGYGIWKREVCRGDATKKNGSGTG